MCSEGGCGFIESDCVVWRAAGDWDGEFVIVVDGDVKGRKGEDCGIVFSKEGTSGILNVLGYGEEHCGHVWYVEAMEANSVFSNVDINGAIPVYGYLCCIVGQFDIWTVLNVKHVYVVEVRKV